MNGELERLKVENVGMGRAIEMANEYLVKICKDVIDRDSIGKPREVVLKIMVTPEKESGENLPEVDWKVSFSVPGAKGITTRAYIENGLVKVSKHTVDARQRTVSGYNEEQERASEEEEEAQEQAEQNGQKEGKSL